MIAADKRGLRAWLWAAYVRWAVRRAFRGVWVDGAAPTGDGSLLFYANHPGWWDGFVFHQLTQHWGLDGYCVMEEAQLMRFPFLRRLGAFSIVKTKPLESVRYTNRLLKQQKSAVIIFPEGELSHEPRLKPLMRGVEMLAEHSGARCVPLGIRYAFLDDRKPDIFVSVGEAHAAESLQSMRERLQGQVDRLTHISSTKALRPLRRMN